MASLPNQPAAHDPRPVLAADLSALSRAELIHLEAAVQNEWRRRNNPLKLREIRVVLEELEEELEEESCP